MEIHEFRALVEKPLSRAMVEWQAAARGVEPPEDPAAWAWQVRDVVAGMDVASGTAGTEEEAREAAEVALREARAAEKARLEREGYTFGLGSEEEIEAAFEALPK
jgi:hypothetical protein